MTRSRKVALALAAAGAVVLAPLAVVFVPQLTGPLLPAGATRLHITTAPPGITFGCAAALLSPSRVATAGGELTLVSVESGDAIPVVWPGGFGAWQSDGRAVLADQWGNVIAIDGDVLDTLGGGLGPDDVFRICPYGIAPRAR
jgi:hypothetical protein